MLCYIGHTAAVHHQLQGQVQSPQGIDQHELQHRMTDKVFAGRRYNFQQGACCFAVLAEHMMMCQQPNLYQAKPISRQSCKPNLYQAKSNSQSCIEPILYDNHVRRHPSAKAVSIVFDDMYMVWYEHGGHKHRSTGGQADLCAAMVGCLTVS